MGKAKIALDQASAQYASLLHQYVFSRFQPNPTAASHHDQGLSAAAKGAKSSPQTSTEDQLFPAKFELVAKRIWGNAPSAASRSGDDIILQRMIPETWLMKERLGCQN